MRVPGRPDPRDEPGTLVMEARELVMRVESGGRFRLVGLLFTFPARFTDKVGDQWPLVLEAGYPNDGRNPPIIIVIECAPFTTQRGTVTDVGYETHPKDRLVVIPVPPAQASRELEHAASAGRRG